MSRQEMAEMLYLGRYVEYAGAPYEVMGVHELGGCMFLEIRDEPPSDHRDRVKLTSCNLVPRDREPGAENP